MIKSNSKEKNEEGITLIALVITIVVLLILAGISIQMLTGDNGILTRAGEAKQATEKANAKEQIQVEVLGSFDAKTNQNLTVLKDRLGKIGAEVKNSDFPLYVIYKGNEFIISENGEMTDLGNGGVTLLAKINAQVSEMSDSEKLNFYQNFYGKTVNYQPKADIQTSTSETNVSKKAQWKIFYADENNIYLIADSYVTYESLPSNGDISFAKSNTNNLYKANFNKTALLNAYSGGTTRINEFSKASILKELNHDFFHYKNPSTNVEEPLTAPNYASMMAVASMLDTDFWDTKYKDNTGYAEYTIGAPSIEMLFASYNQTHADKNYGAKVYKAGEKNSSDTTIAGADGYKISKNKDADRTANDWQYYIVPMLDNDTAKSYNNIYVSDSNTTNAEGYWISSPSSSVNVNSIFVGYNGFVGYYSSDVPNIAFRPIICLKSNILLKELPEGSDYDFELSF